MFVKNTSQKTIGFGSIFIVPGDVGDLPKGYDDKHPTINFFLAKGWLTKADASVDEPQEDSKPPEPIDAEKAAAQKVKEVAKMNLEQLRAKAVELAIEFTEADTKSVLIDKITAKMQAGQE